MEKGVTHLFDEWYAVDHDDLLKFYVGRLDDQHPKVVGQKGFNKHNAMRP